MFVHTVLDYKFLVSNKIYRFKSYTHLVGNEYCYFSLFFIHCLVFLVLMFDCFATHCGVVCTENISYVDLIFT